MKNGLPIRCFIKRFLKVLIVILSFKNGQKLVLCNQFSQCYCYGKMLCASNNYNFCFIKDYKILENKKPLTF